MADDTIVRAAILRDTGPAALGTGARRFASTLAGEPSDIGGGSGGQGGLGGEEPKLVLFASSYGRLSNQSRNFKYALGATDGTHQFAFGSNMADTASPTVAFNQADDDRTIFVPGACEAIFDSFEDDSVFFEFTDTTNFPKLPNMMMAMFGGDDFEVNMGIANVPTTSPVTVAHGLSGAPTGFFFFSTGKPLADGVNRNHVTMNLGCASLTGATLRQWCHSYFSENGAIETNTAGQLRIDAVALDYNLTDTDINNWTLALANVGATTFDLSPNAAGADNQGDAPGANGDVQWIAFRGVPCEARVVDMPQVIDADWTVNTFTSGEPAMFLLLLGTMLNATNSINIGANGGSFGLSFIREQLNTALGFRIKPATNLALTYSQSLLSTDAVRYQDAASGANSFSIDAASFKFTSTGWTVPAARLNTATTGPRKAGAFIVRSPAIGWLTDPICDQASGSQLTYTASPNCDGIVYAMLVANGASAPNAAAIIAAAEADLANPIPERTTHKKACTAYSFFEGGIIGLPAESVYDLYVTLTDNAGRTATPIKLDVALDANEEEIATIRVSRIFAAENASLPYIGEDTVFPMVTYINWWGAHGIPAEQRVWSLDEETFLATRFVGATGRWGPNAENNTPPKAVIDRMKVTNPDFFCIRYQNSSYSPDAIANAKAVEGNRANNILYYHEGVLTAGINNSVNTFAITLDGAQGLKASTVAGSETLNNDDFVTVIRVMDEDTGSDEIMRLETVGVGGTTVIVTRNFDGRGAQAHGAGAHVIAPIYIGSAGGGANNYPGSGDPNANTVRYAMQVEQPSVNALPFMIPDIIEAIEDGGRDGAWLDIFSPQFFNMVNAQGDSVDPWNMVTFAGYTNHERMEDKQRQLPLIQDAVIAATGRAGFFYGNNLKNGYLAEDGGAEAFFVPTDLKPVPLDGGNLEGMFADSDGGYVNKLGFENCLKTMCDMIQKGYPVICDSAPTQELDIIPADTYETDYKTRQFYDFVGIMLGWEFGNPGARVLTQTMVDPQGDVAPGEFIFNDFDFWRSDIGVPVGPSAVLLDITPLHCAQYTGTTSGSHNNTFLREWTRACAVINPQNVADNIATVLPAGRNWRDSITGEDFTELTMAANEAHMLWAWDFEVDVGDPLNTVIGTVVGTHGTGPYTYTIVGDSDFNINASTGAVTLNTALIHTTTARYGFNVRIEDSLGAVVVREFLVVTTIDTVGAKQMLSWDSSGSVAVYGWELNDGA